MMNNKLSELVNMPVNWVGDQAKGYFLDLAADFLSAMPILIGVSIGVYALLSMVSKTLAKMGVVGVFIYGGLMIIVL